MELLGDRNWYFPHWLEWLPEIHVEGMASPEAQSGPGEIVDGSPVHP